MPAALTAETKKTYTYKDYEKLPEGTPYQLIGGELVMTPSPVPLHQDVSGMLFYKLKQFLAGKNIGKAYNAPLDVYFSDTDTYQPDIIFISKDRLHIIGEKKIEGAPDLIIEILSPATAYYDLRIKKDTYEKSGVKEYWIVDPIQKIIEIFTNKNKKFELAVAVKAEGAIKSLLLPELVIEAKEIFA